MREIQGPDYLGYEPALDGLRAIAILATITVHAAIFLPGPWGVWFPGGWIGVDIFFVLSGFLITRLLADEMRRNDGIGLGRFYIRRVLRLLPAYAVMLLAVVLVSACVLHEPGVYRAAMASIGYIMNWSRAFGWFPQASLGHTWSLSMEEQFYILWPGAFILLRGRRPLAWLLALIAAVVVWRCVLALGGSNPERVYNGFDTHADTLLIGCALAVAQPGAAARRMAGRFAIVPVVLQPFTVPVGISGFVATGGDIRGSLLQFFDLAVSALIYYPFFKAWERVLIQREEAATRQEESRPLVAAGVR